MRRNFRLLMIGLIIILLLGVMREPVPAAEGITWQEKVDPGVLSATLDGEIQFLVRMKDQADISAADHLEDKNAKGDYVYKTLTSFAETNQKAIRSILDSIGVTYLLWSLELGTAGIASFFTGHILSDLAWYALVSFIIATGRKAINDRIYSYLLMVCGIALIGLGAYFIFSGISFLTD